MKNKKLYFIFIICFLNTNKGFSNIDTFSMINSLLTESHKFPQSIYLIPQSDKMEIKSLLYNLKNVYLNNSISNLDIINYFNIDIKELSGCDSLKKIKIEGNIFFDFKDIVFLNNNKALLNCTVIYLNDKEFNEKKLSINFLKRNEHWYINEKYNDFILNVFN